MSTVRALRPRRWLPALAERWLRRRTPLDLPLSLGYRQIFILPTRFGWMLGALMGAMLVGSLNFNNNLGLLTTFTVAAIAINTMLLAYRNLRGLEFRRASAEPGHAGTPVAYRLWVHNPDARDREGLRMRADEPGAPFSAPAATTHEVVVELAARHRGWHRPGRMRIETTQPMGLFRAWSYLEPSAAFLVWPRPASEAPPLPESGQSSSGQRHQPFEEGEEFHSLRRWREGDPLHRIAWKASQRHQTLLSREFRQERSREVTLDLARAPGGDLEQRIAIVTAWLLRAESEQRPWTLCIGTERIGPGRGEAHLHAGLRALAEL